MKHFYSEILLVDDDFIANFLNQSILEEMGISDLISVAAGGEEAVELIRSRRDSSEAIPDLILLDINMPGMDGFEFLDELLKLGMGEKTKVIMLTTSSNHKDLDKAREFKISGYLNKPLSEAKLLDALNVSA